MRTAVLFLVALSGCATTMQQQPAEPVEPPEVVACKSLPPGTPAERYTYCAGVLNHRAQELAAMREQREGQVAAGNERRARGGAAGHSFADGMRQAAAISAQPTAQQQPPTPVRMRCRPDGLGLGGQVCEQD